MYAWVFKVLKDNYEPWLSIGGFVGFCGSVIKVELFQCPAAFPCALSLQALSHVTLKPQTLEVCSLWVSGSGVGGLGVQRLGIGGA